jgi:hypothetical protein
MSPSRTCWIKNNCGVKSRNKLHASSCGNMSHAITCQMPHAVCMYVRCCLTRHAFFRIVLLRLFPALQANNYWPTNGLQWKQSLMRIFFKSIRKGLNLSQFTRGIDVQLFQLQWPSPHFITPSPFFPLRTSIRSNKRMNTCMPPSHFLHFEDPIWYAKGGFAMGTHNSYI